jgi:rRNA-processing protein FCF1
MEIVLDTSFVLTCLKEGIDFLEAGEYGRLVLPIQVLEELDKLQEKPGKEGDNVRLALDIIGKNKDKFKVIDLRKRYVDSGILNYVKDNKVIIATIDAELKRKLRGKAKILTIRARKKLVLE